MNLELSIHRLHVESHRLHEESAEADRKRHSAVLAVSQMSESERLVRNRQMCFTANLRAISGSSFLSR